MVVVVSVAVLIGAVVPGLRSSWVDGFVRVVAVARSICAVGWSVTSLGLGARLAVGVPVFVGVPRGGVRRVVIDEVVAVVVYAVANLFIARVDGLVFVVAVPFSGAEAIAV